MHGGLANKMKSCSSSERVQAGVGHQGRGYRGFQSRVVLTKKDNLRQSLLTLGIL